MRWKERPDWERRLLLSRRLTEELVADTYLDSLIVKQVTSSAYQEALAPSSSAERCVRSSSCPPEDPGT